MAQVTIQGNTYPVRDQLKAIGAKWDPDGKCWTITDKKAAEANAIVAAAPPPAPATPGLCRDCGKACKAPYTLCWSCKDKREHRAGRCTKCHAELDGWDRQHGMRWCVVCRERCRERGGNYAGGQSYYDRQGNFHLGGDD